MGLKDLACFAVPLAVLSLLSCVPPQPAVGPPASAPAPTEPGPTCMGSSSDDDPDQLVLDMPDSRLTLAQLDELTGTKLRRASLEQRRKVYAIRQEALEQHIAEVLLQAEARRLGLKNQNELMVQYVIGAAPLPTDDQVRAF